MTTSMSPLRDPASSTGKPVPPAPADPTGPSGTSGRAWPLAALDGLLAGGLAIAVATFLGGVMSFLGISTGTPAPIAAIGGAFIDRTPPWLKTFAISAFGTHDKTALLSGMAVVLVLLCAGIGIVARRTLTVALVGLALIGAVGALAVVSRPNAGALDILPTALGALAGIKLLQTFAQARDRGGDGLSRRRVIAGAGALVVGFFGSRFDSGAGQATASRAATLLPKPTRPTPSTAGAQLDVAGISPYVVKNDAFYRIDTAFVVPHLDATTWRLKVVGEVEQEVTLDWATLLTKPLVQKLVTLTCVSNEVGGNLIGNALWTGWPVRELLAMAKPKAGADMVLSKSSDGFTAGTPLQAMTDDRDALLAVAMNGEPLPFEHGFPVRLVVPGLYGYVSATKWVTELKVTRFSADQGYWTPRGWSALGPVKTSSRVDVPSDGTQIKAGRTAVAGVAWAQHRGIDKVEVQVDKGAWQVAKLATEPTIDSWRQWVFTWEATSGSHTIAVRATDATGAVQIADPAPPDPNGAQGYHTITVRVA